MNISINFSTVSGTIMMPASKSMSQRVCAAALLLNGTTIIRNLGKSDDETAAINIVENLGAELSYTEDNVLCIKSEGNICNAHTIDCGESGLAARLFTPIAALYNSPIKVTGKGSLLKRPMSFLADVLPELHVSLFDFMGQVPFSVCGPLKAKDTQVNGSLSSQFISGLLFAFAHAAKEKVEIEVLDLVSKPYIDLTLEVLALFGRPIGHTNYRIFTINPDLFTEHSVVHITIEGDWSSAAFWIAAATINGSLALLGLNKNSTQADKIVLEIVNRIGAKTFWKNEVLHINSGGLNAFEADLTDAPDLFPVLAVLAACCQGQSKLMGLHRLVHKESNRAESITYLLSQLEVSFFVENDTLLIMGATSFKPIQYNCPNDHRMAMAAALAAMNCPFKIKIQNVECVHKSYPDFWQDLEMYTGH